MNSFFTPDKLLYAREYPALVQGFLGKSLILLLVISPDPLQKHCMHVAKGHNIIYIIFRAKLLLAGPEGKLAQQPSLECLRVSTCTRFLNTESAQRD